MTLLLLSSLAFAASPLDVARAINIIVRKGEMLPPQTITKTFGEGQTAVTVSTTMHSWGYDLSGCNGYEQAGLIYGTVLNGHVNFIAAIASVPSTRGNTVTVEAIDVNVIDIDIDIDNLKLDGKVDHAPEWNSQLDTRSQQYLYDQLFMCMKAEMPTPATRLPSWKPYTVYQILGI